MENRIWLSLAGIAIALALLIGIGPAVMAQTTATPTPVAGSDATPSPNGPRGGPRGGHGFGFMKDVATKLGLTMDELMTELKAGKSIADVATAHNVALDSIVEIMIKPKTTRIQELVTKSVLTQTEADSYLQITRKIITNQLKQVHKPGDRPAGADRPGKRDGTGHPGGCRATPTATTAN